MTPDEIRKLRGERTRADFAAALGVTPLTVYRWELPTEAKESRRPRGRKLAALERFAAGTDQPPAQGRRAPPASSSVPPEPPLAAPASRLEAGLPAEDMTRLARARQTLEAGSIPAAIQALTGALSKGQFQSGPGRTAAGAMLLQARVLSGETGPESLAALMPLLAATEAGFLAPDVVADVELCAALLSARVNAPQLDVGKVNAHAGRARGHLGPQSDAFAAASERLAAARGADLAVLERVAHRTEDALSAATAVTARCLADEASAEMAWRYGRRAEALRLEAQALAAAEASGLGAVSMRLAVEVAGRGPFEAEQPDGLMARVQAARDSMASLRSLSDSSSLELFAIEAEAHRRQANFDEVKRTFEAAEREAEGLGCPVHGVQVVWADVLVHRGEADDLAALAERLTSRSADGAAIDRVVAAAVRVRERTATDPMRAVEAARVAVDYLDTLSFAPPSLALGAALDLYRSLILARSKTGVDDARARLDAALERRPSPWHGAMAARHEGILAVDEGRDTDGQTLLETSLSTFQLVGDRVQSALARGVLAASALVRGAPDGAASVERARAELSALGVKLPRILEQDQVERYLRKARPRASAPVGPLARLLPHLRRLSVHGVAQDALRSEFDAVLREVFPKARLVIKSQDEVDPKARRVVRIPVNDGGGLRLVAETTSRIDAETRAGLEILCHTASMGLELSRLHGFSRVEILDMDVLSDELPNLVAVSPAMRAVRDDVLRLSASRATVLVTGESGVGKEVIARAVHDASTRSKEAYVAFNCAAVSKDLFEGQLFGYVKGAFTGATDHHDGVIRAANGGTLFLDEVGELPLDIQPKLLRFIENGEVFPVGATRPAQVDVRLVAATNRDLEACVRQGDFREDLFYRLNVVLMSIPPLRDRPEDVLALARRFLEQLVSGDEPPTLSPAAQDALCRHAWPGNVRELRNTLERAVAFSPTPRILGPHHLGLESDRTVRKPM